MVEDVRKIWVWMLKRNGILVGDVDLYLNY